MQGCRDQRIVQGGGHSNLTCEVDPGGVSAVGAAPRICTFRLVLPKPTTSNRFSLCRTSSSFPVTSFGRGKFFPTRPMLVGAPHARRCASTLSHPGPERQPARPNMKRELNINLSGNEVHCTGSLMLPVKKMLCSKRHWEKGFISFLF